MYSQAPAGAVVPAQPPVVRAGESLTGAPIRFVGKETLVKLADGAGATSITILEDVSPPHHGPPLHKHAFEEFFHILSGRFIFEVDGKTIEAQSGDFVHAPSDVPHAFQNITDQEARMLVMVRPGGIENYFVELADRMMIDPSDTAALNAIGVRYGITILGPPIGARSK
jgi:quercetin dioxygenase-like cupin family protein